MLKLSNDQAYRLGIKLAMEALGLEVDEEKLAQMPAAAPMAAGPAMAAPAAQAAQAVAPQASAAPPAGMQPMAGAAPGSFENPNWQEQAMPAAPPMKNVLRIPSS